jgi:predicted secreted hydrolase
MLYCYNWVKQFTKEMIMWRIVILGVVIVAITLFGFSLVNVSGGTDVQSTTRIQAINADITGFTRATEPLDWQFPENFGAHPDYQTEWWYYTGNLTADSGERFGFQFTVFRRAMTPTPANSESEWRDNQIYLAHFTVSDLTNGRFYHDERYSRAGDDLAGAQGSPRYRVWIEDWQIEAVDDTNQLVNIRASNDEIAVDLMLEQVKPPALQGQDGLSPKSSDNGNASHYYSLSRLLTNGTLRIDDRTYTVEGLSWKDHEFSTSALASNAQGWDWFGLIFDNNTEMMIGQIRLKDGGKEPAFGGMFVFEDGTTQYLPSSTFTITPTGTWTSPHTGATYPSGWDVVVDSGDIQLEFTITPLALDQELYGSNVEYWEGAVEVTGDVNGVGYAELTGYVDAMAGRF